jgi:hypothetical protein
MGPRIFSDADEVLEPFRGRVGFMPDPPPLLPRRKLSG